MVCRENNTFVQNFLYIFTFIFPKSFTMAYSRKCLRKNVINLQKKITSLFRRSKVRKVKSQKKKANQEKMWTKRGYVFVSCWRSMSIKRFFFFLLLVILVACFYLLKCLFQNRITNLDYRNMANISPFLFI